MCTHCTGLTDKEVENLQACYQVGAHGRRRIGSYFLFVAIIAENSHQRTRQQERQMRRFKSAGHAQRFLSMHGMIHNIFNLGRHLISARCFHELRVRAFLDWRELSQVTSNVC
jgi:transposase-like protein